MFKVICKDKECANKNEIYYFTQIDEIVICGGCKKELIATQMSQTEFDKVFDYDPYKQPEFYDKL